MTNVDLGFLTMAVLALIAVAVTVFIARRFQHDEIYEGVAPGVIPPRGMNVRTRRVQPGQEYAGEIAVAFAPPRGVNPGLIGTIVDGRVDSHDLTATIVDLAVRGHVTIAAVPGDAKPNPMRQKFARRPVSDEAPKTDWVIEAKPHNPVDELSAAERRLLASLFHAAPAVRLSQLDQVGLQGLRETQVDLYREVVNRGWYRKHPQKRSQGPGLLLMIVSILFGIVVIIANPTLWGIVAGVLFGLAGYGFKRALQGRTPRTALGTAVQIQALGFKTYLQTAEAEQFRFEEAAGIFSRYLPYAMAFGVADHWAKVFGQLAKDAKAAGVDVNLQLDWFTIAAIDALDIATDLMFWDLMLDGDLDFFDLGAFMELGGDAIEGLTAFAGGLGDFMGSLDFLDGLGDGCGDIAGCIDT